MLREIKSHVLIEINISVQICYMAFSLVLPETCPFSKRKQQKREKESCFAAKSKQVLFFFSRLSLVSLLPIMAHVI